ncbi:hypothetical protein [Spirosoma aerolatum]|uniref:hypothetical protein n=1 Tax=Spirosoma aerolatum TaxID=1211326 RepID=UPI0009AC61CE|nr:hypothetical protein [Spirosoma aerolatum]
MTGRKKIFLTAGNQQLPSITAQARVHYSSDGRSGTVHYSSPQASFSMWYEFAGGDAIAIIDIPTPGTWVERTKLPLTDRETVLQFIGDQVVRDQVPGGGYFDCSDNTMTIYRGQKPV